MRLNSLQFLRALAVGLVVYAHSIDLQMKFSISRQQHFFYLQNFGAIGVDLFFVISGFVITLVAQQYTGAAQGMRFLVKRFVRINPLYYIATAVIVMGVVAEKWMLHKSPLPFDADMGKRILQTLFVLPLSYSKNGNLPLLPVGWTLSFEWWFYLLFFFAILKGTKDKALVLAVQIGLLVALGYLFPSANGWIVFITNPIMLEFVLGVMICRWYLSKKTLPATLAYTCLAVGACWYAGLVLYGYGNVSEVSTIITGALSAKRFLYWGIPGSLIVAGCVLLEQKGVTDRLWKNKWVLLAGNASFSIYLVHQTFFLILGKLYPKTGFFMPADMAIVVQWVLAMAAGIVFYRWVEVPLLRLLRRKISSPVPAAG